jgi:hypothetical protein
MTLPRFLFAAALLASGCAPSSEGETQSSEINPAARDANEISVRLVSAAPATFDLHVRGVFPTCLHSEPELSEVRLTHPPRFVFDGAQRRGALALTIEDSVPGQLCHVITTAEKEIQVRLDARPDAVHQLSPRLESRYVVSVNGRNVGLLDVGIDGVMTTSPL